MAGDEDKKTSAEELLHAWELGILSPEEAERFELEMMQNERLFEQVRRFQTEADILLRAEEVRKVTHMAIKENTPGGSLSNRLARILSPQGPVLGYLLILLLIYPAFVGVSNLMEDDIRPLHSVSLFPARSANHATVKISPDKEVVLSFVFRGAVPGKAYRIALSAQDQETLLLDKEFTDFDDHETGRLLLPAHLMRPGFYRLIITDPGLPEQSPQKTQEYDFSFTL